MKRSRPVTSCLPCRRRRVGCDREHPSCGRCITTNQICSYDESAEIVGAREQAATASATASSSRSSAQPTGTQSGSNPSTHDIQGRLVYARAGRSLYNGATFWGNPISDGDLMDVEDLYEAGAGRSNSLSEDTSPLWTNGPFRPPQSSGLKLDGLATSQCRLCGRGYRLVCVLAMLPDPAVCTRLCEIFFGSVFPVVPILHLKGLRQDLAELWAGQVSSQGCKDDQLPGILRRKPGLLCLLASIAFSTLYSTSPKRLDEKLGTQRPKSLLLTSLLATMISAALTGFPRRPSLYTLAAYIYVQSQFNREEEFHMAPEFITTSFRLAISMGLHRELRNDAFSVPDRETRRRLWWYIMHLDVMASASSGLSPIFVDDKMSNVSMIHEHDEDGTEGNAQGIIRDLRYVVAVKRYEVSKEIHRILRLHFEDAYEHQSNREETVDRLERLAGRIQQACGILLGLADSIGPSSENLTAMGQGNLDFGRTWSVSPQYGQDREAMNFAAWAVVLLHMMMHKAFCIFYHPLFAQSDSQDPDADRITAVKHSQAYLYLFVRLCNDVTSSPFQWMYPGTYQPLQAVSLLIADLLKRPHSNEAESSRGFIDRVFEMYSIDHGIVGQTGSFMKRSLSTEGRSTWRILARARRKALDMVGEDAHILIPNPVTTTTLDHCVCGARIASSSHSSSGERRSWPSGQGQTAAVTAEQSMGIQQATSLSTAPRDPSMDERYQQNLQDETMTDGWPDTDDLNWQEFVALAGYTSGFIS